MSVQLTPSTQLGFERPLTTLIKKILTIKNPNATAVSFKVKTTSPRAYCVRPNSGRIEPNESVEVQVLLQPMKEDPPTGTKCRDKFLVQSVLITPERENSSLADLWTLIEKEDKLLSDKTTASIHEQKIRCVYLPSLEDTVILEEPRLATVTPITKAEDIIPSTPSIVSPKPSPPIVEVIQSLPSTSTSPSPSPSTSTPTPPIVVQPQNIDTQTNEIILLRSELKDAQSELAKLRKNIIDSEILTSELRKRTVATPVVVPSQSVVVKEKEKSGVPVSVFIGVVTLVFLITYTLL